MSSPAPDSAAQVRTMVLSLPGWLGSGPTHWQSRWEMLHGFQRVEQNDWNWPRRGDWMARLDEVIADLAPATPVSFVAHSLGCLLVATWSGHSRHVARVRGALLVAPPDTSTPGLPPQLQGWRRTPRERLPFATCLVASRNDPYASYEHAQALARGWGARLIDAGPRGHLNADSGLGDWPQALDWIPR